MIGMRFSAIAAALLVTSALALADVTHCACDISNPETLGARECGLCKEAETQPADAPVFLLKDNNPRKPNRWLALPRAHIHALADMTPEARVSLWNATIEKAKSLWGTGWGLAMNGDERRTQCHTHIHIGKLLEGVENPTFEEVDGPAGIPVPKDGSGFWIHPVADKLHVHSGEQVTEFFLMR
jgi:diadenosine tetraphosphate (Ap4A) HIT family hydrolase